MGLLLTVSSLAMAAPDLVLISMDTTRADALSCYGAPPVPFRDTAPGTPRTPVLDALAQRGVRFASFRAQSPSTLASHTTMFSGRDPHATNVVRNGFPLPADLPTLATRLATEGYQTHAVVGAAALEESMGLSRGFQTYNDKTSVRHGLMHQSPASEVVQRALDVAARRAPERPTFLFVHFFDAHAPYDPPEPFLSRFVDPAYTGPYAEPTARVRSLVASLPEGDPAAIQNVDGRYLAGVAALDHQIGRLLDGLDGLGMLDEALVVVTADHGEGLSDARSFAWGHGSDVRPGVMQVPLLMEAHGIPLPSNTVVHTQTEMAGLAPTIESLLGLQPQLGTGFADLLRGPVRDEDGWPERPTRTCFQEATRPRRKESKTVWNNLPMRRAVFAGGHRLEASGEHPVGSPHPQMVPVLLELLKSWNELAPPHRSAAMPASTVEALEALGYLSDD